MIEEHTPKAANNFVFQLVYLSGVFMFIFIAFVPFF